MSWNLHELGKLIDEVSERRPDNELPVYSVTNSSGFTPSEEYFSKQVFSKDLSNYKIVRREQFAYNPSRINVGSIDFLNCEDAVLVSPLYVVFQCRNIILPQFLKYFLKSQMGLAQIASGTSGSVRDSLKFSALSKIRIPLPPLPIQKRIAEILDAADALRKKDKELLKKYDELAQAIFIDMFGDPVKNEKGWEIGTIRDIVAEVKYGTSKPADPNGSIPYLRMNNITYGGEWDLKDLKFINLDEDEYEKYIIKNGDLVFNRTNSKELVGKTAVYNFDNEVAIAGYLIRVRANDKGNPYYISGYLNSKHGKKTLEGMCKSIVGMANINAQELQNIQILIPPIKVQQKYASLYDHVSNLKNRLKSQIFESGKLFQNTLQKAFSGELVS